MQCQFLFLCFISFIVIILRAIHVVACISNPFLSIGEYYFMCRLKNPPAKQESCVQSLGWEDPLEKEMTNHSSILVWKIPWTEEPGGLYSMGSPKNKT